MKFSRKTHGGARENSGRPGIDGERVVVKFLSQTIRRLELWQRERGIGSRAAALRKIVKERLGDDERLKGRSEMGLVKKLAEAGIVRVGAVSGRPGVYSLFDAQGVIVVSLTATEFASWLPKSHGGAPTKDNVGEARSTATAQAATEGDQNDLNGR